MIRNKTLLPLWENLLDPHKLKPSLVQIGLYLCVHEMLIELLIAFPESIELDDHPERYKPEREFRLSVVPISHGKRMKTLAKSWKWWVRHNVLTEKDTIIFESTHDFRHEIAHEGIVRLLQGDEVVWGQHFNQTLELVIKLAEWWRNNGSDFSKPNLRSAGHDLREILHQNVLALGVMIGAAIGDEAEALDLLTEFRRQVSSLSQ